MQFVYRQCKQLQEKVKLSIRIERMTQELSSLQIFTKQISNNSYAQKYKRWVDYLQKLQSSSPEEYLSALTVFLQQFPFNYVYWVSYAHYTNNESSYQLALRRNSKSFQLWSIYLLSLKSNSKCDSVKYKKQLQRAIFEVGADTRAIAFYQQYYHMLSQNFRYQFYKKIVTRALIGLEDIFDQFKKWLEQLNQHQVNLFYTKQLKGAVLLNSTQLTLQNKKTYLYDQIEKVYLKTLRYREQRITIQDKIQRWYFQGSQQQRHQKQYWQQLLEVQRRNGVIENISYCYQRQLMAQTDNFQLWEQVFHYLQHQTNKYTKVLSMLRNNKLFFMRFSKDLYFYWCDLEQRENANKARQMYKQICATSPCLQGYQRYVQFEIREKNYNQAKQLYDSMLGMYATDYQTLAYVLIQYSHFVVKYYKDYQYPKQLIKNYFDYLPYNAYLLTEYLNFMLHFQNHEGYYDQLMTILTEAVKKAKKTLTLQQFNQTIKMIKHFLRNTLGSIYLIKMSQRRIIQIAQTLQLKKDQLYHFKDLHHHQQQQDPVY